jgi:hypothetical protein
MVASEAPGIFSLVLEILESPGLDELLEQPDANRVAAITRVGMGRRYMVKSSALLVEVAGYPAVVVWPLQTPQMGQHLGRRYRARRP